jgi:hypothetical protein
VRMRMRMPAAPSCGRPTPAVCCPSACTLPWCDAPQQVPCRGRGQSPSPLAVNIAVWEIRKALAANPSFYILVHCTHGYNRSGACSCVCLMARGAGAVAQPRSRAAAQLRPCGAAAGAVCANATADAVRCACVRVPVPHAARATARLCHHLRCHAAAGRGGVVRGAPLSALCAAGGAAGRGASGWRCHSNTSGACARVRPTANAPLHAALSPAAHGCVCCSGRPASTSTSTSMTCSSVCSG